MRKMNLSATMKKHIYNHKKPQKQTVSQLSLIKHSLERTSYTRESPINGLGELRNKKKTTTQFVLYAVLQCLNVFHMKLVHFVKI